MKRKFTKDELELFSCLDIEKIVKKRKTSEEFSIILDKPGILDKLSEIYKLEKHNKFESLLEEYDRNNLSMRCLKYHPINKCVKFIIKKNDCPHASISIKKCEYLGYNNWNKGLYYSIKYDSSNYINYFIKKGANNWNTALKATMKKEVIGGINFFLNNGACLNIGLKKASKMGNKKLIDFFIEKGANCWDWCLRIASEKNHKDLIDFFIEKGANKNVQLKIKEIIT